MRAENRFIPVQTAVAAFIRDEDGATSIEYGLIAAGIGVTLITGLSNQANALTGVFSRISGSLDTPQPLPGDMPQPKAAEIPPP